MRYKVYDTAKKQYIADDSFILKPSGRIAVNEYGDEIGQPQCIALFFPGADDSYYIDDIGGLHDSGCGWNPRGEACGECSNVSCSICGVWKQAKC